MTQAVEMWLMSQMKAYGVPMKNCILIRVKGHLCKEALKNLMWPTLFFVESGQKMYQVQPLLPLNA